MTVTFTEPRKAFNPNYRKDNLDRQLSGIAVVDGKIKEVVTIRIYGTNSRSYCAAWVYTGHDCKSGTAYAGGYGYHRASAAMEQALYNAGIDLGERISGCGDSAMTRAVESIARAVYPSAQVIDVIEAYA